VTRPAGLPEGPAFEWRARAAKTGGSVAPERRPGAQTSGA